MFAPGFASQVITSPGPVITQSPVLTNIPVGGYYEKTVTTTTNTPAPIAINPVAVPVPIATTNPAQQA